MVIYVVLVYLHLTELAEPLGGALAVLAVRVLTGHAHATATGHLTVVVVNRDNLVFNVVHLGVAKNLGKGGVPGLQATPRFNFYDG